MLISIFNDSHDRSSYLPAIDKSIGNLPDLFIKFFSIEYNIWFISSLNAQEERIYAVRLLTEFILILAYFNREFMETAFEVKASGY